MAGPLSRALAFHHLTPFVVLNLKVKSPMQNAYRFVTLFASLTLAAGASAQHAGDIGLGLVNNRITTGIAALGTFTPGERVFGSEFGEVLPNFTDEPGFDSLAGAFPLGTAITFNVHGGLRRFESGAFSSAIDPVRLSIGFATFTPVLTPTDSSLLPGFAINVNSNGEWHRHLQFTLQSPATNGIYLLEMSLVGNSPLMQESQSFWIVFNQNALEADHDAAMQWVNQNLVPSPGAGILLAGGGMILARRRRAVASAG